MTLAELRDAVRSRIARQQNTRLITNTEIDEWLNEALVDLVKELKFLRKFGEIDDLDKVLSRGSNPYYYQLPSDFIDLAPESALMMNGLRRLPLTEREFYKFQQMDLTASSDTIYGDEFFQKAYNGVLFHYGKELYYADEVAAGRTGRLAFFIPNLTSGWGTDNLAAGLSYTAATFVCDTADSAPDGAKGHFTDSIGTRLTLGEGNFLPEVAVGRRVQLTVASVATDFIIKTITGDGEADNEVEFVLATLALGSYDTVQINKGAIQFKYLCRPATLVNITDVPQIPVEDTELLIVGACMRAAEKLEARNPRLKLKQTYEYTYERLMKDARKKYLGIGEDEEIRIYPYPQWADQYNSENATEVTFDSGE